MSTAVAKAPAEAEGPVSSVPSPRAPQGGVLRNRADVRTLIWAFVLFPSVAFAQYVWPSLAGWLLPLGLYVGFCSGVFSHNHNHCPTFKSRRLNVWYAAYISAFYGYPTFAWIPTHNQ